MPAMTFLLVDGTALAYRAFYAITNLTTRAGLPTNAVFGFIKLLRQLEQMWKPTHWLVAFDGGLPAERMALLDTYKAQREEMPDALRQQLEWINEYVRCADVPSLLIPGEEADDIMATFTAWARGEGADVLLATSDKDMFQLVNDRVAVVSMTKTGERMGPAEVKEKTGVPPPRIVDWLALTGDTADNIPGVPGVGGKTAARLIEQFDNADALWPRIDEVASDKLRQSLLANRDAVNRNKQMMALRTDLPCERNPEALRVRPPDYAKLAPFLERMEFHTMLRDLQDKASRLF